MHIYTERRSSSRPRQMLLLSVVLLLKTFAWRRSRVAVEARHKKMRRGLRRAKEKINSLPINVHYCAASRHPITLKCRYTYVLSFVPGIARVDAETERERGSENERERECASNANINSKSSSNNFEKRYLR